VNEEAMVCVGPQRHRENITVHSFIHLVFQRSTEVDIELVRYNNRYNTERVITIKYL